MRSDASQETDTLTDTSPMRGRLEALKTVERVKGIEPSLSAWEADNDFKESECYFLDLDFGEDVLSASILMNNLSFLSSAATYN